MELGLGIHGEPGVTRARLQSADQLTETLLTAILKGWRRRDWLVRKYRAWKAPHIPKLLQQYAPQTIALLARNATNSLANRSRLPLFPREESP
jgi:dihydroxyacetone kinase